jgi:FAD/FMN-containing dehydrogenase
VNLERAQGRLADILPENALGLRELPGFPAVPEAAPDSLEQAAEVLRLAAAERWRVLPLGRATKFAWARAPREVDLVLSSARLAGIVAYEPADGTLTARAGTPWSELAAAVAEKHHLSPELPAAQAGTFGGVVAAGASGFDRLRFGPLRHQLLGLSALHADASLVKSGGRVVKNVTGYDLHRLWCGSHGTLCFLVEGTLRLYPAPDHEVLARLVLGSRTEGIERAHALLRAHVHPLAAVLQQRTDRAHELVLFFAGREAAVRGELAAAEGVLGTLERVEGPAARAERQALAALELSAAGWAALTLAARPSRLAALLAALEMALRQQELTARVVLAPMLARVLVDFAAPPPREARLALERALEGHELAWRDHSPGFRPALRVSTQALALMERLKRAVDPHGLFVRGRFHDEF